MGSRDLGGHYDRLPGGEFDDIGANPAGLFARVDVLSSPSRHVTSVTRFPLFPVSSSRMSRWTLTPTSPSLPVAHRASFFSRSILIVSRAAAAFGADDHAGQPRSASAYADPGNGERLVAMCPKCRSQLLIPPGVPTVACGSCGQAISPVISGQYDNASAPAPAPAPVSGGGQMVKCPLCAALLQQPPGASLAICGGGHQVIGMPGAPAPQPNPGYAPPAQSPQNNLPPIISCPACSLQLQPPPDAPLVACGGCRQVMQVPGVEAK